MKQCKMEALLRLTLLFFTCSVAVALSVRKKQGLPISSFDEGYTHLFGDNNLVLHRDGNTVYLSLDRRTGSGFVSHDLYLRGFFSASIKLPPDYTAGVVVAFYMSNGDTFEKTHDELDFEFLGNIRGKEWRVQTNVYGNGSTATGREERYGLPFDPSEDFHEYSVLWTDDHIMFYIDDIPIREVKKESMGGDFPSKPMSLYATIWDGSNWATLGGRYKVNYKYAPYIAEFTNLVIQGCTVDPLEQTPRCSEEDIASLSSVSKNVLSSQGQRSAMDKFRSKHIQYSYCYDKVRYPHPLPECVMNSRDAHLFQGSADAKFGLVNHHRGKRHRRSPASHSGEAAV